jgi:serine/alanine adding enzyme
VIQSRLAIIPFDQLPEWDRFVESHPKGTIFHTAAMVRTMKSTKRHSPFAHAAVDRFGKIHAILAAVKVSTLGRLLAPVSARSILYAEPIFLETDLGRHGLDRLLQHHDNHMRRHTLFTEVRPFHEPDAERELLKKESYEWQGYLNYELDLRATEQQLFSGLNKKCRNNVRSARRRGVTVREVDARNEVDRFYSMVAESYSVSKVPLSDRSLFEAAFLEMPSPTSQLFFAEYEGALAAAACFLAYKGRVIYWYAGARRIRGVAAMALLVWEAILKYSKEGYEIFDFAGAGWEGEVYGPGKFKAKFGGELTNFGRYRKVYSPWKFRLASPVYQISRNWISPTPRND